MISLSSAVLMAVMTVPVQDEPRVGAIAPFVGEEVFAVLHVDLTSLDLDDLAGRTLSGVLEPEEIDEATGGLRAWAEGLREAGAEAFYLVVDPADLPGMPVAVVPLEEGADAEEIGRVLCGGDHFVSWPTCAMIQGVVFAGSDAALERARGSNPAPRPELVESFAASGDGPARLAFIPSENQRRVIEELLPSLPDSLAGGSITLLTRGFQWAIIELRSEPTAMLRAVVQSGDAEVARAIASKAREALGQIGEGLLEEESLREFVADLEKIEVEEGPSQVVISADLEQASELVGVPARRARAEARRARAVNTLKQIGLAMHNHSSDHNERFPPAYSVDEEGRPLLSWRVHILPYIEQKSLYDEFRLDEPWDSPHNAALVERMPELYRNPLVSDAGKTTLLVPRGETTAFPGPQGVSYKEITDGTSNTLFVVDAPPSNAVIWTKPEDWEVGEEPDPTFLTRDFPEGFVGGIADGSVRVFRNEIDPGVLKALLTIAGGELINWNEL